MYSEHETYNINKNMKKVVNSDNIVVKEDKIINDINFGKKYKNNKTCVIYTVLSTEVDNATKRNSGRKMVLYHDRNNKLFVREYKEFIEMFTEV